MKLVLTLTDEEFMDLRMMVVDAIASQSEKMRRSVCDEWEDYHQEMIFKYQALRNKIELAAKCLEKGEKL